MLHLNITVKKPAKTKVVKQRECCYVYHVLSSDYQKDRQFNIEKRVCIGKLINSDPKVEDMFPNDNYFLYYGNVEAEQTPTKSDCLQIGAFAALKKLLDQTGITKTLYQIHGDDAARIIDIICYVIIEESGTMQHFSKYAWNHHTESGKAFDDTVISRLFSQGIKSADIEAFLKDWNSAHTHKEKIYLSYDSTNINTKAEGIDYAEFGHAKDDKTEPQVNLSYAIDHDDATPLFYELYPGSIIDNSQVKYMVRKGKRYGYKDTGLILDRGYFSWDNIKAFDKEQIDFLMMVKINALFIQNALEDARIPLMNGNKLYIPEHDVYGMTTIGHFNKSDKKRRYFHLYYDNVRAGQERNDFLKKIAELEKRLNTLIGEKASNISLREFKKYFTVRTDEFGKISGYRRRELEIKAKTDQFGFFAIVTSQKMEAGEALDLYRKRDSIEKLFRALKTGLEYDNLKVHSTQSVESKTHLIFIASIIRNKLFQAMKDISGTDRKNYTVPAVLRELEKITVIKDGNGNYRRRYGLTAKQKKILGTVGVTEKDLDKMADRLNLGVL